MHAVEFKVNTTLWTDSSSKTIGTLSHRNNVTYSASSSKFDRSRPTPDEEHAIVLISKCVYNLRGFYIALGFSKSTRKIDKVSSQDYAISKRVASLGHEVLFIRLTLAWSYQEIIKRN
jgi:hypothetical protein